MAGQSGARRSCGALELVGLDPRSPARRPGEISGGQRQRVALARAVVLEPRLLICDEPVSALDASNRNYILRTLGELRDRIALGLMVISHDLGSLAGLADRVVVLYRGRIVEEGPIGEVFNVAAHPYTALLWPRRRTSPRAPRLRSRARAAPPRAGRARPAGRGRCVFAPRCRFATESARATEPPARAARARPPVACYHAATWRAGAPESGTARSPTSEEHRTPRVADDRSAVVAVTGNPRPGSRTAARAARRPALAARLAGRPRAARRARPRRPRPAPTTTARALLRGADLAVIASPTYKATYSGLLKQLLDGLPNDGLAGVIACR